MKIVCEMQISEYFKLSSNHIALVGKIAPDGPHDLVNCKADLYVNDQKIKTISIIGEDRLIRVDKEKNQTRRSILTVDNVVEDIKLLPNIKVTLVLYR